MAKPLVSDELWNRIEPLIPPAKPRRFRFPGRKPLKSRDVLTGILFVLKTGIAWDALPAECGWGCGLTCKRYLRRWQRQGIWQKLHEALLAELNGAGQIDWSRALIDSASVRAPRGGRETGPNPTDRRKLGSKHHVLTDAQGIPLAMTLTGAHRHDVTQLLPLVDAVPAVRGRRGHPRRRPRRVQGGPSLRLGTPSSRSEATGDQSGPGEAPDRAWQRPGEIPVVRRTDAVLDPSVRPPPIAPGSIPVDPQGVHGDRVLANLYDVPCMNLILFERSKHHFGGCRRRWKPPALGARNRPRSFGFGRA